MFLLSNYLFNWNVHIFLCLAFIYLIEIKTLFWICVMIMCVSVLRIEYGLKRDQWLLELLPHDMKLPWVSIIYAQKYMFNVWRLWNETWNISYICCKKEETCIPFRIKNNQVVRGKLVSGVIDHTPISIKKPI